MANALRTFTKISFRGVGFKSIHIIHSILSTVIAYFMIVKSVI